MISFPAYVSKVMTMADSSVRIQFDTQELPPEKMAEVFASHKTMGIVAFIPAVDDLDDMDRRYLETLDSKLKGDGSRSKQMRTELYKLWQRSDLPLDVTFENFYDDRMELLINQIKNK